MMIHSLITLQIWKGILEFKMMTIDTGATLQECIGIMRFQISRKILLDPLPDSSIHNAKKEDNNQYEQIISNQNMWIPLMKTLIEYDAVGDRSVIEEAIDEIYGPRLRENWLGARRERNLGHLHSTDEDSNECVMESIILAQYSMKNTIQVFGNDGIQEVLKELKHLHDRRDKMLVHEKRFIEQDKKQLCSILCSLQVSNVVL
jgi:hypothetical protein